MSTNFNTTTSSYNSYLKSNNSFSKEKIKKLEEKSTSENKADNITNSTSTITKNGKTYYVVNVDGESYLYDYANDSYSKFKKDDSSNTKMTTYNAQSDSVSVSDSNGKRKEAFSVDTKKLDDSDADVFSFKTATKDNNIFAKNTVVIDDFASNESLIDKNGDSITNSGLSHGELVSAIVQASGSNVIEKKVASIVDDGDKSIKLEDVNKYLSQVITSIDDNADIDAVNLSISADLLPQFFDLEGEIKDANLNAAYKKLSENPSLSVHKSIIDNIKTLSDKGVSVYISAGNAANDKLADISGGDKITNPTDVNGDGKINGRDYNSFNLLTLAAGTANSNVHIIGSSNNSQTKISSVNNSADYSNYSELVDKLYDGDIEFSFVSKNSDGTYTFNVEGIGNCNLKLSEGEFKILQSGFLAHGTSFATPFALGKDDTSLA